jgi:hypothetical protein
MPELTLDVEHVPNCFDPDHLGLSRLRQHLKLKVGGGGCSPVAVLPLIIVVVNADFDVAFPSCGKCTS